MTLLDDVVSYPAFALVRLHGADTVTLLGGARVDHDDLGGVPLEQGPPPTGRRYDRLLCVPYAQIRERGFEAHDDGTPLTSIDIDLEASMPTAELLTLLPDDPVETVGPQGFDIGDEDYARIVGRIIADEIGNGEGANLVIGRTYTATVAEWDIGKALTVFRRLLERERGAYWTYVVFTGDRYLIGASPERHISVHGGEVRMNPISGTFRVGGIDDASQRKDELLRFLDDEKEIYELFMVVDEELKMMCDICSEGGQILGPYLKAMTHLMHTEYILAGRTTKDVRDVLRSSMYAATVTGSPVENACRLIRRYESGGRGYYGAVMALLGRDASGAATADAPILLRTADVSVSGDLRVTAGATLVRDSDPEYEVAETHAKAGGILTAFGLVAAPVAPSGAVAELALDEDVLISLHRRNERLSRFWFTDQSETAPVDALDGKHVVVLDGEDDFVNMLQHVLRVLGMTSETVHHSDYAPGAFDAADVVVVGPGPGDPRDVEDAKIKSVRAAVDELLRIGKPFLAVCLGHQVLCGLLGIPLVYKDIVFQGTQTRVAVMGREENVGFYNTFVARVDAATPLPPGVSVDSDPLTGDVHHLRGPHYRGVQFHAESILTEHGADLVRELMVGLLSG
ncbi:MAG: 2-amino-4-deoxychorismate synthase [Nocardioidaceae bacterium]|jgi:phenazine biosynthesis protein phzE|nr:2-amino-4-deoxychorismate synthase [Nocardioidaceae bacterium]